MAKGRIIEIDILRTFAILMMVAYHVAYDLYAFYDWDINLFGSSWQTFRIITASLFLLIAGVTSNFSRDPLRRAMIVIGCALLITAVTYVYDPSTFIYFGILHCLGIGMLLLILFRRLNELNILLGIAVLFFPTPTAPLPTLDYYPFLPWFGLMLIGYGIGHYLYIRNDLRFLFSTFRFPLSTFPGRHSLIIYLVHQPIILLLLRLLLHSR